MRIETRKLQEDIRGSAERILRFTSGKQFSDYRTDDLLRSGVERQFEVIGEALNRIVKLDPVAAQGIPYYRRVIDYRNVLSHGYDVVEHSVV